jgi:hypothetical protein
MEGNTPFLLRHPIAAIIIFRIHRNITKYLKATPLSTGRKEASRPCSNQRMINGVRLMLTNHPFRCPLAM